MKRCKHYSQNKPLSEQKGKVNPSKSLSLVLKTKKVTDARLKGELSTVSRIQINVLGKFLNNTLTDEQNLKDIEACRQLNEKMKTVDKVAYSVNIKATAERMETTVRGEMTPEEMAGIKGAGVSWPFLDYINLLKMKSSVLR